MFIQELDRPFYLLVEKAGFFDKELTLDQGLSSTLVDIQNKAIKAQEFLRTVYMGGDRPKVEVPLWLVKEEQDGQKLAKLATEVASRKTLQLPPKAKASSSNTNPSS